MRYFCFVKMREDVEDAPASLYEAVNQSVADAVASGEFLDGGGLAPTADSTEVQLRGGEIIVTNGPWAEAKEVAGGYSLMEYRTHEDAVEGARKLVELHKEHWPGVEMAVEVRRVFGVDDA